MSTNSIFSTNLENNSSFLNFDINNFQNFPNIENNNNYSLVFSQKKCLFNLLYKNKYLYPINNSNRILKEKFQNDNFFNNIIILTNGIGLTVKFIIEEKIKNISNIFLIMVKPELVNFFFKIVNLKKIEYNLTIIALYDNDDTVYNKNNQKLKNITQNFKIKKNNDFNKVISINFVNSRDLLSLLGTTFYETHFISFKVISEIINTSEFGIDKYLISKITKFIQYKISSLNSIIHFSKRWKTNILHNLNFINSLKINKISSIEKDIIIFASSPNTEVFLQTNKKYLKNIKKKFLIFSIPSTLTLLNLYKLEPDFLFSFDGSFFNYFNFPKIEKYNILTSLLLYHSIIKSKKDNSYYLINLHTPIEDIIYKDLKIPDATFHGSSVNTLISYLNRYFKSNTIYIIGSDYKNLNRRSHHRYYQLYNFRLNNSTFLNTPLTWETKIFITSKPKYSLYKTELDEYSNIKIINWNNSNNDVFISNLNLNKNKTLNNKKNSKYKYIKINNKYIEKNFNLFSNKIDKIINDISQNNSISNEELNLLTFLFTKDITTNIKKSNKINFFNLLKNLEKLKFKLKGY